MDICSKLEGENISGKKMDRISSLPDEILVRILDYLPTDCAVATSILSTRWKYLFQLTTNLRFEYWELDLEEGEDISIAKKINSRKRRFKKFVYDVLRSHQVSPIKLFSLETDLNPYSLHHYAWINAAIHKQVQELYLRFEAYEDFEYCPFDDLCTFPRSLFNSKTLVVLQIHFLTHQYEPFLPLEVPSSISLPNLKNLHLKCIRFCDSKSGKRFFSGCFSLEELTLVNCRMERKKARDSMHFTTLKKLTIVDMIYEEWIEIDAPSLTYVTIDNSYDWDIYDINEMASKLVTFIHSVTHLSLLGVTVEASTFLVLIEWGRRISITNFFELLLNVDKGVSSLSKMARSCGLPFFPNVAWLELGRCHCDVWKHIFHLLNISPRLETIIFRKGLLQKKYVKESKKKWITKLEGKASNSWHVGFIEVYKYTGDDIEIRLIKLLLRNAKILKCLTLHKGCHIKMKDELQKAKELLMLPRASKYCQVQLI